jgi:hypothetical protein
MSPTTPTTTNGVRSPSMLPNWITFPSGSPFGHSALANAALTIAACTGAPGASRSSNSRPRSNGMPIARKYPGLATRNSACPARAGSFISSEIRAKSIFSSGRASSRKAPLK